MTIAEDVYMIMARCDDDDRESMLTKITAYKPKNAEEAAIIAIAAFELNRIINRLSSRLAKAEAYPEKVHGKWAIKLDQPHLAKGLNLKGIKLARHVHPEGDEYGYVIEARQGGDRASWNEDQGWL
jgi:hypothetical protein